MPLLTAIFQVKLGKPVAPNILNLHSFLFWMSSQDRLKLFTHFFLK